MELKVQRLDSKAILPKRGSEFAAGYDLFSIEKKLLLKGSTNLIRTGISIEIPFGYYGRIAPRSSLSLKFVIVGAGVVDSDYRGELKIVLHFFGNDDLEINEGEKIAQLIIEKIATPNVIEVFDLSNTQRGDGGFGSTGKY